MRVNRYQKHSLHLFHSFAAADRIDTSAMSDTREHLCLPSPESLVSSLLPSYEDDNALQENIQVLISRVLVQHMKFFSDSFKDIVPNHIPHDYGLQMSQKTEVVPLGILAKNENKVGEMIEILNHIHQNYVPTLESESSLLIESTQEEIVIKTCKSHNLLLGGDQLTVARSRSAISHVDNGDSPSAKLTGLIPVIEDWHSKMTLLNVIWKHFYSLKSGGEHGTLYQLRNLLGRTNVKKDPSKSFDECEDFLLTAIEGFIVTAAMHILRMKSLDDVPDSQVVPEDSWLNPELERKRILSEVTREIFDMYVRARYATDNTFSFGRDSLTQYQAELLRIGLFYCEYRDAIKEGDGHRVLRCWRYLLPIFFNTNRKNYSKEALYLLCQHKYLLTERQSFQLLYNRFVNIKGGRGHNVPSDLHMEHLNKLCKGCIRDLGPNKTISSIVQASKCIGTIDSLLVNFDSKNGIKSEYGFHKKASCSGDIEIILDELMKYQVMSPQVTLKRKHSSFKKPKNLLSKDNHKTLIEYMITHIPER